MFSSDIINLTVDPSVAGYAAFVGERALNTLTGILYLKSGPLNTDWIVATTAFGGSGPAGPAGADGTNGIDGTDGDDGLSVPGADGADGLPGADGDVGPMGLMGDDGDDGPPGSPGDSGLDGAPGADGADGAPGIAGDDGDDGISLPGEDGADGAQGIPGPASNAVTIGTAIVQVCETQQKSGHFFFEPAGGFSLSQVGKPVMILPAPGLCNNRSRDEADLETAPVFMGEVINLQRMRIFWASTKRTFSGSMRINYLIGA